jgi:hypothetical protein
VEIKGFFFSKSSTLTVGPAHFAVHWVPGALSLRLQRQGLEADHSPQPRAETKNEWSCTSIALYAFKMCQGTTLSLLHISQSACDDENKLFYITLMFESKAKWKVIGSWSDLATYRCFW